MSELFEIFWYKYPRKISKKKCKFIWDLNNFDDMADEIIEDIENRKNNSKQWQDVTCIPHPSTYLNQERWLDDII